MKMYRALREDRACFVSYATFVNANLMTGLCCRAGPCCEPRYRRSSPWVARASRLVPSRRCVTCADAVTTHATTTNMSASVLASVATQERKQASS